MVRQKAFAGKLLIYSVISVMLFTIISPIKAYAFDLIQYHHNGAVVDSFMESSYSNDSFNIPPFSDDSTTLVYYFSLPYQNLGYDGGKFIFYFYDMPEMIFNSVSETLSYVYTYDLDLVVAGKEYNLEGSHTYDGDTKRYPTLKSAPCYDFNGHIFLKYTVHLTYTNMGSDAVIGDFDLKVPAFDMQIEPIGYKNPISYLSDMVNKLKNGFSDVVQTYIEKSNEEQVLLTEQNELQQESNDTQKNIFEKITDFFNNFFSRLGDLLLSLIVPSAEDLTAFLDEVNEWFSDRLGFIWYPFGFAVDAVSALAGGDANTQFTVPALQINMLGGTYTIWNEMSVDIDAFDIFKYVRLFTSFICVGGIVALAYNKWDEWIGGHGVG